jgi:hypothetical protein
MVNVRKIVIIAFFGIFVAWLLFFCWIHLSYASDLPDAPDTKAGRTYRMVVNHGFVRYGTERELHRFRWAENAQVPAIAFLAMGIVLAIRWKHDLDQNKRASSP